MSQQPSPHTAVSATRTSLFEHEVAAQAISRQSYPNCNVGDTRLLTGRAPGRRCRQCQDKDPPFNNGAGGLGNWPYCILDIGRALGGKFVAKVPSAARELRGAIKLAMQDEASIGKKGLDIRMTEAGEAPIFGHVLPLTGSDLRTRLQPAAVAAVFIGMSPGNRDTAEAAAAAFNLTPAETRVLSNLLGGRTLAETAATLGIAATTAKSHLENIFTKTGVARQADLMRLATSLAPPTRLGH
jgi:DNA-binding CsgD family transcriptional regulator